MEDYYQDVDYYYYQDLELMKLYKEGNLQILTDGSVSIINKIQYVHYRKGSPFTNRCKILIRDTKIDQILND